MTTTRNRVAFMILSMIILGVVLLLHSWFSDTSSNNLPCPTQSRLDYKPRKQVEPNGLRLVHAYLKPWHSSASLEEIAQVWDKAGFRLIEYLDNRLAGSEKKTPEAMMEAFLVKSDSFNFEGQAPKAYEVLEQARSFAQTDDYLAQEWLYTLIYLQGVTALRRGENDNCILCRGESLCILPISGAAVHRNPLGSRLAIEHFMEYLEQFPDDLEVRWLLNLAHMTLNEYPEKVDPRLCR